MNIMLDLSHFRWVLAFFMGVAYFFGGIAKINPDWLNGMPLRYWLKYKDDILLIGPLVSNDFMGYFMSYAGLALDLFVVFFLLIAGIAVLPLSAAVSPHFYAIYLPATLPMLLALAPVSGRLGRMEAP